MNHNNKSVAWPVLFIFAGFFLTSGVEAETASARVLAVSGGAMVFEPGAATGQPVVKDSLVAPGSKVVTESGGSVVLGLVPGAGTIVKPGTELEINKLEVEKNGNQIAKRDVEIKISNEQGEAFSFLKNFDSATEFKVVTPKGVAAARGTAWNTTGLGVITVANGNVTWTLPGGRVVNVPAFFAADANGTVTQISEEDVKRLMEEVGFTYEIDEDGTLRITTDTGEVVESENPAIRTEDDEEEETPNEENTSDETIISPSMPEYT